MDDPGQQQPASGEPVSPQQPPYPGASWQAYPPPPVPRRHRVWPWVLGGCLLFFGLCAVGITLMVLIVRSAAGPSASLSFGGGGNIAVVDIDGIILSADRTVDQLRKFDQDDDIKAIILHINSPGGAAAPSQEIYHEVLHIRDEKKKPMETSAG